MKHVCYYNLHYQYIRIPEMSDICIELLSLVLDALKKSETEHIDIALPKVEPLKQEVVEESSLQHEQLASLEQENGNCLGVGSWTSNLTKAC